MGLSAPKENLKLPSWLIAYNESDLEPAKIIFSFPLSKITGALLTLSPVV